MNQVPPSLVTKASQPRENLRSVTLEMRRGKPGHVLKQDSAWPDFLHKTQRLRKQVPFVRMTQPLTRDRKRRARHPSRHQVNAAERSTVYTSHVIFNDLPVGAAVQAKRLARIRIKFNDSLMSKARLLKAQCLAASPSTDLKSGQLTHFGHLPTVTSPILPSSKSRCTQPTPMRSSQPELCLRESRSRYRWSHFHQVLNIVWRPQPAAVSLR
jgi:hypothetical protein